MQKSKKFLTSFLILITCLLMTFSSTITCYAASSEDYHNVDTSQKIYDYADLFTDTEEQSLKEMANSLIDNYGYDVFFVTIDYNDITYSTSNRTMSFIEDFGDYNGFGLGEDSNYIACIIDMDCREIYVDVTGIECFKVFTDSRVDSILDAAYNYLPDGEYYSAAKAFLNKVDHYGNDNANEPIYDEYGNVIDENKSLPVAILKGVLTGLIISGVITFLIARQAKTIRKGTEASKYISENLELTKKNDRYVRTYETKVRRSSSSSGGGGGTSTHRSSSGRSHSGGGRRF